MTNFAAELSSQFTVPGLNFHSGEGGLTRAVVATPLCSGEVYLHGAHVTKFQPAGQQHPVLWLSRESNFASDKAIRGGVPICFPWFGPLASDPKAPAHGTARVKSWSLVDAKATDQGGVTLKFTTQIAPFDVAFQVEFSDRLVMSLQVTLDPSAASSSSFEAALHSYFTVSNIHEISIKGLETVDYIDKVDHATRKPSTSELIRFDGECDRVYLNTSHTCKLDDPGMGRTIHVAKTNSRSTIVWNPWIEKSTRMADFGNDEWTSMVCIETANVADQAISLSPGQSHHMAAEISVSKQ